MDKLLEKPVYLCARGESGIPTTDLLGRPLPMPIGHRRGEPLGMGGLPVTVRRKIRLARRQDTRVVTWIADPNPKKPGTRSHARFLLYRVGMTLSEFLDTGGVAADIVHDINSGLIRVELPRAEKERE